MKRFISMILGATIAAGLTAYGYQAQSDWPPALKPASKTSPVLTPGEALKSFVLPPGYRLELVASEPLIQDPVFIDWDPEGRMWAVEMPGYMLDITASRELEPLGRVVVFEDTNADGKMDKRTVFADGLVLARALKVLDRGVLVGEPPNLWLMRDTNGDLKMDSRELVTDTYGRRDANVEHNANGLFWAMDNRLYTSETDTYVRLRNGKFEVNKTLSRGQWGLSQDDAGRIYRNTNSSALYVDLVPTPYFTRNPTMLRTRGSYEFLGQDGNDINITWPIHPTAGVNRGYQDGVLREDGTLSSFTAVAAPTIYRGDRLPAELSGNAFVVEPSANLVSRIIIDDDGKGLRGRKAYARGEFIVSTDERFRPVYLSSAPDGTLYVVDLYRGIIQHKGYITEYLRDQILSRNLEQPTGLGRVYRVVHETTKRDSAPALSKAPVSATGRDALSPERVVAGHRPAAAGRAKRQVGDTCPQEAGDRRQGFSHEAARVVGPRWHGEHRPGDRHSGAGRPPSRRARGCGPSVGEMAEGAGARSARGGGPVDERQRLGGQGASGGIARRAAGWRAGGGARVCLGSARRRSDCRGRRAQRHEGHRRSRAG